MTDLMFQTYLIVFGLAGLLFSVLIMKYSVTRHRTNHLFSVLKFSLVLGYGLSAMIFDIPLPPAQNLMVGLLFLVTVGMGLRVVDCYIYWVEKKGKKIKIEQQQKVAKYYGIENR